MQIETTHRDREVASESFFVGHKFIWNHTGFKDQFIAVPALFLSLKLLPWTNVSEQEEISLFLIENKNTSVKAHTDT